MPELQRVRAKLCGAVGTELSAKAFQRSSKPPQHHSWGPKAAAAAFQILPVRSAAGRGFLIPRSANYQEGREVLGASLLYKSWWFLSYIKILSLSHIFQILFFIIISIICHHNAWCVHRHRLKPYRLPAADLNIRSIHPHNTEFLSAFPYKIPP